LGLWVAGAGNRLKRSQSQGEVDQHSSGSQMRASHQSANVPSWLSKTRILRCNHDWLDRVRKLS
jgi:hypothetical protein